ncbi:MAG: type II toxin-antitoxin system ParD family antitoxin [Burkholderiales bacterium]|nr:type II toxin-antitoxin system ParD family antitoxin [Burkholderiales bacterium]
MNIWLPPDAVAIVREKFESGLYESYAQVIQEALILLEERDQTRALRTNRLLKEIANGIDQANTRQLIDALEVFRTLRRKAAERIE